jgi:D-sedoheptulose 7-phosphate isomerase
MDQSIREIVDRHRSVADAVVLLAPAVAKGVDLLTEAFASGRKVLVMGNGGSAADAQHLAAELVGRFIRERRGLPAIALTTDSSILTAVGNDYGFDAVFSRQIEALAVPGDVVIGISTSGNSANVLQGIVRAQDLGCRTMGLLGRDGGSLAQSVDLAITIPNSETARVQEGHILIIHILCDLLEQRLFP